MELVVDGASLATVYLMPPMDLYIDTLRVTNTRLAAFTRSNQFVLYELNVQGEPAACFADSLCCCILGNRTVASCLGNRDAMTSSMRLVFPRCRLDARRALVVEVPSLDHAPTTLIIMWSAHEVIKNGGAGNGLAAAPAVGKFEWSWRCSGLNSSNPFPPAPEETVHMRPGQVCSWHLLSLQNGLASGFCLSWQVGEPFPPALEDIERVYLSIYWGVRIGLPIDHESMRLMASYDKQLRLVHTVRASRLYISSICSSAHTNRFF